MPTFAVQWLQRLRNAGLGVYTEAHNYMVEDDGKEQGPRVRVEDDEYRLFLYSLKDKWIVEAAYGKDEKAPCDFVMEFATPQEAVDDAIKYFKKDERWQAAREHLDSTGKK